jgi:hypothetical protein
MQERTFGIALPEGVAVVNLEAMLRSNRYATVWWGKDSVYKKEQSYELTVCPHFNCSLGSFIRNESEKSL